MRLALLFLSGFLAATATASPATGIKTFPGAAAVSGTLTNSSDCTPTDRRNAQVWLSVGQTLLYQVEVPSGGTYEFHVLPGKYDLASTNSKGCVAQAQFTAKADGTISVDLKLTPSRSSASLHGLVGWLATTLGIPDAEAAMGWGCGTLCMAQMRGFCPTCGPMMGPSMMPWGMPSPWWWNTGPMMYSNFYSPAPWSYGPMYPGVMPGHYPGNGGFYAAKPNLYLEGKHGTEISIRLKFNEPGANWLSAVPVHGEQGWKATLAARTDGPHQLRSGPGTYGYLFSDYRVDGKGFQDQAGFCAGREAVIEKMALGLKQARFNGREIADFMEYWSVKLPQSKKFCVYPQDERQLDPVAPLEITPAPSIVRRVLFVVQVEEGLGDHGGRFTKAPKVTWTPPPFRTPAAADALVAREWGVGFLAAKK